MGLARQAPWWRRQPPLGADTGSIARSGSRDAPRWHLWDLAQQGCSHFAQLACPRGSGARAGSWGPSLSWLFAVMVKAVCSGHNTPHSAPCRPPCRRKETAGAAGGVAHLPVCRAHCEAHTPPQRRQDPFFAKHTACPALRDARGRSKSKPETGLCKAGLSFGEFRLKRFDSEHFPGRGGAACSGRSCPWRGH